MSRTELTGARTSATASGEYTDEPRRASGGRSVRRGRAKKCPLASRRRRDIFRLPSNREAVPTRLSDTTAEQDTMPKPISQFWRRFNVALRLLGFVALLAGIAVIITTDREGEDAVLGAVGGGAFCLVGVAFIAGRTFRPDLGDVSYNLSPFGDAEPRRWFTGDRKAERG